VLAGIAIFTVAALGGAVTGRRRAAVLTGVGAAVLLRVPLSPAERDPLAVAITVAALLATHGVLRRRWERTGTDGAR